MANYGRGWDEGYGGQSAESVAAYQEREAMRPVHPPRNRANAAPTEDDKELAALQLALDMYDRLVEQVGERPNKAEIILACLTLSGYTIRKKL